MFAEPRTQLRANAQRGHEQQDRTRLRAAHEAIRGGDEQTFSAGLNWFWNPFAKIMLDYQRVRIDRLSPATSATVAGSLWQTPIGAPIGQDYGVFSLRTQFSF